MKLNLIGNIGNEFKCQTCGKIIRDYPSKKRKYCGLNKCLFKARSLRMKKNNPSKNPEINKRANETKKRNNKLFNRHPWNWKGGISRNKLYTKKEWIKIIKKIYKRDNWNCQICGNHGGLLNCHHIDQNPLNNSLNNLITLCPTCHAKIHGRGGDLSSN